MPNQKLKNCPFCGGKASLTNQEVPEANGYPTYDFRWEVQSRIYCISCSIQTAVFQGKTKKQSNKQAIEAWNRRSKP